MVYSEFKNGMLDINEYFHVFIRKHRIEIFNFIFNTNIIELCIDIVSKKHTFMNVSIVYAINLKLRVHQNKLEILWTVLIRSIMISS